MRTWSFKTPNMRTWRRMRYDTTEEKFWPQRVKELYAEATSLEPKNVCLYTDVANHKVQIMYDLSAERAEAALGRDDHSSAYPQVDKYRRQLDVRAYPQVPGEPYAGRALPSQYDDMQELLRLAKLIDGERAIHSASVNLETLISTLLGKGLKRRTMQLERWTNTWQVELEYDGYVVEISQTRDDT